MTENSKKNVMNNFVVPFFKTFGSETNKKMLNDFKKETGSIEYDILTDIAYTYEQLLRCAKNYKELNKKVYTGMNMVVPHRWEERYHTYVCFCAERQFELDPQKKEVYDNLCDKLEKLYKDNPEIFKYFIKSNQARINDMMFDSQENLFENTDYLSDENISKLTKTFLITTSNVKFYHGTSYKNYLKILEDGFIKATDYSDAKYPSDEVRKIYENETGYVFVMDSLDIPLAFSFGGYRKNAIPWAYNSENHDLNDLSLEEIINGDFFDDLDEIGVVFEIDPTKYELYFYTKDNEFMIKGDISIDDVNVLFFKMDKKTGHITQITETDLRRDGIIK